MQRALSAENLAGLARGTIEGLKRLMPGRSDTSAEENDLRSISRAVEQKMGRVGALDDSMISQLVEAFSREVDVYVEGPSFAHVDPSVSSPSEEKKTVMSPTTRNKRFVENEFILCLDLFRSLHIVRPDLTISALIHFNAMERVLRLALHMPTGSGRKLYDCCCAFLHDFIPESAELFTAVCGTIAQSLIRGFENAPPQLHRMRIMLLFVHILKRADMVSTSRSNEAKSRLSYLGAINGLIAVAEQMQAQYEKDNTNYLALTCGILCLSLVGGICRSNEPNKVEAASNPKLVPVWVYYASSVHKMLCTFPTGRNDDPTCVLETASFWATELAEVILEIATSGSISLERQALYEATSAQASGKPALSSLPLSGPMAQPTSIAAVRKWEPLPSNWDAVLSSGSLFVWRMASAAAKCTFSQETATMLLKALSNIDVASPLCECIYRTCMSTLVFLCHTSPKNSKLISEAGCFDTLVSLLSPSSHVFSGLLQRSLVARTAPFEAASQSIWPITTGLLTTILTLEFPKANLAALMNAVERIPQAELTQEDCDIIEMCFNLVAVPTYPPHFMWMNGVDSSVTCSMERLCGRWYGYTYATWINPVCVWPEGGHLFSFHDPSIPASTVVCVVANGRSRCLAVRSTTNKEVIISLLPDTTLNDGWTHVCLVHNIGGLTPYINGRKCTTLGSAQYPKEPPKPHRLTMCFGGGPEDSHVPPMFGMMTTVQVVESALTDKDIEKLVALGPCSTTASLDPALSNIELIRVGADSKDELQATGTQVKPDGVSIVSVSFHGISCAHDAMKELDVVQWALRIVKRMSGSTDPTSFSVIILCIQLVAGFLRQHKDGVTLWHDQQGPSLLGACLRKFGTLPPELLSALFLLITGKDKKLFRSHPSTAATLLLYVDLIGDLPLPPSTRQTALRELSNFLNEAENVKVFREDVGLPTLLETAKNMGAECIEDLVTVAEKLIKEPMEMDHVFRYLVSEPSSKHAYIVKCELLRMLYDVSKHNTRVMDLLSTPQGVTNLHHLLSGESHDSEALRVYSLRLLALILHCPKKQKELFIRNSGFDILGAELCSGKGPRVGLATYNCLFKMALDFFQPNNNLNNSVLSSIRGGGAAAASKTSAERYVDSTSMRSPGNSQVSFNGHMPSIMPLRQTVGPMARTMSYSGSSECSDLEARLSIDESYNSQSATHDLLVYPQCCAIVLQLITKLIGPAAATTESSIVETGTDSGEGIGSDLPSSSPITDSVAKPETAGVLAVKVLGYLDRMMEISRNANTMLSHPWLEWIWSCLSIIREQDVQNNTSMARLDAIFRNIIRKIAVEDILRTPKVSTIKHIKDFVDAPSLQYTVIEELVSHFTAHNRLDVLSSTDSSNVLRNLDSLLQGLDDSVWPMPMALGLEVVHAIGLVAVNNNESVRAKMKDGKLFDSRDKLVFTLFTSIKNFAAQSPSEREALLQLNVHDANISTFFLKCLCDAVKERSIEGTEALQSMLRYLCAADEEQKRNMTKLVADQDVVDALQGQRKAADGAAEAPPAPTQDDLITWTTAHDAKWEGAVQRIVKAFRPIEVDLQSRQERREKEKATKLRTRKAENEKRLSAVQKVVLDSERARQESVLKATATYTETLKEVAQTKHDRNALRDGIAQTEKPCGGDTVAAASGPGAAAPSNAGS